MMIQGLKKRKIVENRKTQDKKVTRMMILTQDHQSMMVTKMTLQKVIMEKDKAKEIQGNHKKIKMMMIRLMIVKIQEEKIA